MRFNISNGQWADVKRSSSKNTISATLPRMSLTRSLALNTGVQMAGKIVSTTLGIVIIGVMTRYLGQEGFGAYSTANAFLQVFALLLDLGINVTLIAMLGEHSGDEAYEKRCVSALFTLRMLIAVPLIGVIAPLTAWITPYPTIIKFAIIGLSASFIFPSLNQIITGVQQKHLKMHIAAVGEVLGRFILLGGLFFARAQGWGLLPVILFVSLGSFGNFLWCLIFTSPLTSFRWNWDPAFWKITLKRSWPIGVSIAFNLIYFKADTLVLSLVRSQAEVGIYSAAYRVLEILVTVPFMYAGIVLPILSQTWAKKNYGLFARLIGRSIDLMWVLILPMVTGTLLLGPRLLMLVAGPRFVQSGEVLRILIIAVGMIFLNVIFSHVVVALNAQRKMIPIYIAIALVTLTGYILFIPQYGMWAAAWLTVFSEIAITAGSLFVTLQHTSIETSWKIPASALAASIVMAIVLAGFSALPTLPLILIGVVGYFFAAYLFGAIPKSFIREVVSSKTAVPSPLEPVGK